MGGFPTQLNQDPPVQAAGPSTPGQNPPSMLGQDQQQPPDAVEQLKQVVAQRALQYQQNQAKQQSGGRIKQLLTNFIGGAGAGLVHAAGLPTQEEQYQRDLTTVQGLETTQANVDLHKSMAGMYGTVPIQVPDSSDPSGFRTINVMHKDVPTIQKALISNVGKQNVADTMVQGRKDVAQINQGAFQLPIDHTTATLAGVPEREGQMAGAGEWKLLNSALNAKGYKVQDMAVDGPQGGMWIVDKGGNKVNQISPNSLTLARGRGFAEARAEYTPFETVEPGTNIPTTISNKAAIQRGSPKVTVPAAGKIGGQYALYNDAYGILKNIDNLSDKVNLDDPSVRARVTAGWSALKEPASKGMPMEVLSNFLAHQPVNAELTPNERALIISMGQGKAAALGFRGIMGQAGVNEMQQRMDSMLTPGAAGLASKAALKQQTAATRQLLNRFSVGIPQVGMNAPNTSGNLENIGGVHIPGGQAQGLQEGATGTGSDGKKYVVKGGVWASQ